MVFPRASNFFLLQNLDEVHSFFRDLASAGTGIGTHHNPELTKGDWTWFGRAEDRLAHHYSGLLLATGVPDNTSRSSLAVRRPALSHRSQYIGAVSARSSVKRCSRRHASMCSWWPDIRMDGTACTFPHLGTGVMRTVQQPIQGGVESCPDGGYFHRPRRQAVGARPHPAAPWRLARHPTGQNHPS